MKLSHQAIALLVTFIWGTNFVFIRIGLDELSPFTFAAVRFFLVSFPLVFFLQRPTTSWLNIASYGLFIGVGQFGLLFWAMQGDISPGLASLVVQTQVLFTILFSILLFSENINKRQIIALVLCFSGLSLIIIYTDGFTTLFGVSLTLAAAASWACGNLVVKRVGDVNIISFIAWSSLFAIPPLLLLAIIQQGASSVIFELQTLSLKGWSVVLWQSIGNTMIGYGLWNMLLNRYNAAVVVPWLY